MPNWCFTGITFYSEYEEQLRAMHDRFEEIRNGKSTVENDFGHGWMGDYANVFLPEYGHEKVDCRGSVTYIGDVEITFGNDLVFFKIETETAWDAKVGMWQKIVEKYYPDVKIAYVGEECGCGYFVKYDETGQFYGEEYYLDGCLPAKDKADGDYVYLSDEFDGCGTRLDLEEIQEHLDLVTDLEYKHANTYQELSKNIDDALSVIDDEELYFSVDEYAIVPPADFDFLI